MNPKRRAFVNAYLTTAAGNATQAAIQAGYSAATAPQIASRLLRQANVKEALEKRLGKADAKADRALENVIAIANRELPEKVNAATILKANELILQVEGKLKDKSTDGKVIVNIGFLTASGPDANTLTVSAQVMPPRAHDRDSE